MAKNPLSSLNPNGNKTSLRFPHEYDGESGNWIIFSRVKYMKPDFLSDGKTEAVPSGASICLPMPPQLQANYRTEWSGDEYGIAGAQVTKDLGEAATKAMDMYKNGNLNAPGIASEILKNTGKLGERLAGYFQASTIDAGTNTETFAKIGQYKGFARNPHKAFLFKSPNFRYFSFTYKLIAKSPEESETIKNIIKEFKMAMMPSYIELTKTNLFEYPDMYQIKFAKDDYLFKFGNCILMGCGVDYHGESVPAYYGINGTKAPVSVNLTLDFQETKILTREDMEDGM